ncbi:MAG: hypothetical protein ABI680_20705 [Chthoniobacteraceae bacterium]
MSSDLQQLTELFDAKVQSFEGPVARRFQALLPFKQGILRLREKNASSRTIAELLKQLGVTVSHNTVARFCRELAVAAARNAQRADAPKQSAPSKAPPPSAAVTKLLSRRREETKSPEPEASSRGRGPRIADPKNV